MALLLTWLCRKGSAVVLGKQTDFMQQSSLSLKSADCTMFFTAAATTTTCIEYLFQPLSQ